METLSVTFFLASVVLLNIMPGPSMLYVAQQTLQNGLRAGVISIAGIEVGTIIHILASVLGLTIIIANSKELFFIIQCVAAAFLIYLGISQFMQLNNEQQLANAEIKTVTHLQTFTKAMCINILNPKILIFFIALLPQFVDTKSQSVNAQVIFLGSIFGVVGGVVNLAVTFATDFLLKKNLEKNNHPNLLRRLVQLMSFIFILLGVSIIFFKIFR